MSEPEERLIKAMTQGWPERVDPDALKDTASHRRRWKAQGVALVGRGVLEAALKHLKRAGHNRRGEAHKVYPAVGEWGIEYDVLPCNFGLLPPGVSRRSFSAKEDVRLEAASIKECICGYNDTVAALERALQPGIKALPHRLS